MTLLLTSKPFNWQKVCKRKTVFEKIELEDVPKNEINAKNLKIANFGRDGREFANDLGTKLLIEEAGQLSFVLLITDRDMFVHTASTLHGLQELKGRLSPRLLRGDLWRAQRRTT